MTRLLSLAFMLLAAPAFAHHPLNGLPMKTFIDGILSGIGHPVLGFDHLFFVFAVGTAAALTGRALMAPLAYIATMLAGVVLVWAGIAITGTDAAIILSLLALGGWIALARTFSLAAGLGLFAVFGLFHGLAFGASVTGIEGQAPVAVLAGYLIGLATLQYAICGAVSLCVAGATSSQTPRLIGAGVAGVGVFILLETLEGPLLAALAL